METIKRPGLLYVALAMVWLAVVISGLYVASLVKEYILSANVALGGLWPLHFAVLLAITAPMVVLLACSAIVAHSRVWGMVAVIITGGIVGALLFQADTPAVGLLAVLGGLIGLLPPNVQYYRERARARGVNQRLGIQYSGE